MMSQWPHMSDSFCTGTYCMQLIDSHIQTGLFSPRPCYHSDSCMPLREAQDEKSESAAFVMNNIHLLISLGGCYVLPWLVSRLSFKFDCTGHTRKIHTNKSWLSTDTFTLQRFQINWSEQMGNIRNDIFCGSSTCYTILGMKSWHKS